MTWDFNEDLKNEITNWIAQGKGLKSYAKQPGKPNQTTIFRWQRENEDFAARCARAREAAGAAAAEELYKINKDVKSGKMDAQSARVISSNLQWIASKLAPKTYGDVKTIKGDADNPIQVQLAGRLDSAINRVAKITSTTQIEGDFIDVTSVDSVSDSTLED